MTERHVLFLCTGNTARSILAEGILRKDGAGRFVAHSAGSRPKGAVNPLALKVLREHGYPAQGYSSKGWEAFAGPQAPRIDFVVTVCDSAAGEDCPVWPGRPAVAHWGIADPAAVEGADAEKERAFVEAFGHMRRRIHAFLDLRLATLDAAELRTRLAEIGRMDGASAGAAPPPRASAPRSS